ncbi:MAG: 50S ribosomal protein L32 [Candidatus Coatesbacteria bacterium]|jgi:large subunit ribosomal protein L32|nr:50S ribosomal protein L32 [Candidatus Coatesbacteria bacterium]
MAVPKRRKSRSKRDMRKAHWVRKIAVPSLTTCPNCGAAKLPHRICAACGHYKGRQIIIPVKQEE